MFDIVNSIDQLINSIENSVSIEWSDQLNEELIKLRSILSNSNQLDDLQFKENVLNYLANLLINNSYSSYVASSCSSLLLDLLSRLKSKTNDDRIQLFYILSELISLYPEISEYVYSNYNHNFDPFSYINSNICSSSKFIQPNKRIKKDINEENNHLIKLLYSCLNYLYFNSEWFISTWQWSNLFAFLDHDNSNDQTKEINFLIYQCLRVIFNLSDTLFYKKLNQEFDKTSLVDLRLKYNGVFKNKQIQLPNKIETKFHRATSQVNQSEDFVSIGGVLLKRVIAINRQPSNKYVFFDSFEVNLRKLALAVRLDQPVLIEGPVGCGKTSLVECLADLVGRCSSPQIIKLQMGDQIDRKVLIGSYHCTEIPGQFVWKAGPITRALIDGNWIVLEDIDLAPNELINDIVTILKSKSLDSISGCSFIINGKVHNSFRVFFTRRLIEGHSESYRLSDHDIIYKLCERIQFDLPERQELIHIIKTKWPNLETFADKLIDIYSLVQTSQLASKSNRKTTLRDLIKLCNRISSTFNNRTKEAFTLLLDTLDCFINHLSGSDRKLELAKQIGVLYNFTNDQVSAIYLKRKPVIEINDSQFKIGRYILPIRVNKDFKEVRSIYAFNLQSLVLLEQVAASIINSESCLLVGETGNGKTSTIQFLASKLKKNLIIINLNQQTDSTDIIGGYKPIAFSFIAKKLRRQFEELFNETFITAENTKFLSNLITLYETEKWKKFIEVMDVICKRALVKENLNSNLVKRWHLFKKKIDNLKNKEFEKFLAFEFIEGNLINAIKNGDWVLLDEINLAEAETLQFLAYILDEKNQSFTLFDKNDDSEIKRHPDFRLFACMNPSTDVGKRELPIGVRNLFTEIFVEELELTSDLQILAQTYIGNLVNLSQIEKIVQLYLRLKKDSKQSLNGYSSGPYYSLRTFCRALRVSSTNLCKNIKKTLYEAMCLSFLTQLDQQSHEQVEKLIYSYLFGKEKINLNKILTPKPNEDAIELEDFVGYWLSKGTKQPSLDKTYILTDSVKRNLFNLIRIISIGRTFPILLQGETSVGKTSMIEWLAQATGNVCYRINNHDHIDLQEYVGNYTVDRFGKLVFKEGLLVEAMRNGYWLILDELNLASTEVLEALNRVLDDNREIFIPEIQTTIKAHPKFLLFATQNPPENYGGRKILSRAFRNRFIELQFDEIPGKELEIILSRRCHLPPSYSKKMVDVFRELRNRRRESGIFAGKSGFVTLRDLFRWGERYKEYSSTIEDRFFDWEHYLANEGYMLIGGRVRKTDELNVVKEVLEKKFKTQITDQFLIDNFNELIKLPNSSEKFRHIVWTKNSIRLACLLFRALKYKEPVLLVGQTGCGKTTFCQLYSHLQQHELYTVNCHMNTESSDFIGSLRPVRNDHDSVNKLFEWVDGPLVNAMNNGSTFLVDEISLADDSVLERLNSLLEPKRTLFLAEKTTSEEYLENYVAGESESIKIVAKESFRFIGTMNPGGDYAKKELSPALRNRFTEIWCSSEFDEEDIKKIIVHNLVSQEDELIKSQISDLICEFLNWFKTKTLTTADYSIRDILTIVEFINTTTHHERAIVLQTHFAVYSAIELLYIDSIGSSAINSYIKSNQLNKEAKEFLNNLVYKKYFPDAHLSILPQIDTSLYYGYNSFCIPYGSSSRNQAHISSDYIMNSTSVNANCSKVLKAMQLSKSILLEGVPGVGKTSLIDALAKAAGYKLIRINLSEQTDINDLFGADLPVEGKEAKFEWRNGPLLKALNTENCWVLLDELNLASQSVLEGLNACLDHRGEIFIPELNRTFKLNKSQTRIFASQNPHLQGGGRKGLPKSFLNRFITIFIDSFSHEDMVFILENIFNEIPRETIQKMVSFNEELINETNLRKKFSSHGQPWEFNLRDLTRWCELIKKEKFKSNNEILFKPEKFIDLIYIDRFRTAEDRTSAIEIFEKHFETVYFVEPKGIQLTKNYLQIGNSILQRMSHVTNEFDYQLTPEQTKNLESIMKCCEMGWMSIVIGETNVGKSSLVNILSTLTGNQLKVLSVNSEMDSTELLGGFEQQDCARHYKQLENEVWFKLKSSFGSNFMNQNLAQFKQVLQHWSSKDSLKIEGDDVQIILNKLSILKNLLNLYLNEDKLLNQKCLDLMELINNTKSINGNGTFEWIDSVLIESIQNGNWLLIDNANLCSASVLDRINSLLEPNGFLMINERGSINNEIPIIRKHPDFRLFLTMNPKQGELSRAMRNRGIEIYLTNHNMLNASAFILKNFYNDKLCAENSKLLSSFVQSIENQKDLKEKLKSKFFAYYLLYTMKNLELKSDGQVCSFQEFNNLKEKLFSIRSLMGDTQLFLMDNNLELIKSTKPNSIQRSIVLRIIMESTSKDLQLFLLKTESSLTDYFDLNMINHLLNLNRQFLLENSVKNNEIDVEELSIDLRYSLNFLKKLLPNHDLYNQISLFSNIWSLKLFFDQIRNHLKQHSNDTNVLNLSSILKLSSRSQFEKYFPKLFIESFTIFQSKLNDLKFDFCSSIDDEQQIELRTCFNWIFYLMNLCHTELINTNDVVTILDKFVTLWIVCFQKKVFKKLELFKLNLKTELDEISQSLNINFFDNIKDYDRLIKKFTYEIVPKNANTSVFYSSIWQCMNELFGKDYWFLLRNKELIKKFTNLYKNLINDEELEQLQTELRFISTKINKPDAFELKIDDEERKADIELKRKFENSQLTFEANLHAIHQMLFFVMEIQAIDLFNQSNETSSILNNLKSFLSSNNVIINPFHQYLFEKSNDDNKFELILHHCLDSFRLFRNDTTFNLVNFHDTFNLDLSKDNLTQYEFKLKSFLNDNYWLKEEFIVNTSPVFTLILTKNLLKDNLRLGYLNYQQKQIEAIMKLIPANYLNFFGTFLNSKIYYENLFKSWVDLLINQTSNLSNYSTLRSSLEQIIKQLQDADSRIGKSNYLMCSIGIYTCKLFQPVNALDPVQRSNCRLKNYELELNLLEAEMELREKFCKLNYGRGFNSNEDHPHIKQLSNRKVNLIKKIEKLTMTQNFRPTPSLYFKLKSEIVHFMDNVINHPTFERSLFCMAEYIDYPARDNDLCENEVLEHVQMMVKFKKQINYFFNDLLSKYSQYYDLICNYLIGICFVYQSISWLLSNVNKKMALKRLDFNEQMSARINHLFSYSTNEPNRTTDYLLSLLHSTKLTEMLAKTRSGQQHCHTMLYKATLMEILNAFAFQTDHHKTVKLMDNLIRKFLDTWLEQEELKRQKQEEEDALYHYKIRNADEIVNDEEQLTHDVNLNFPTYEDLYSDLMDSDENREFQLNRLDQHQTSDDILLNPEIILEIIDLHRSITESVCKETKLEFNFKDSYKLRYSILGELIESYGPIFDQTLDEMVLDGHLIVFDSLNQGVFNRQVKNFNIYIDYNVDETRKCFDVLEKLKDKIFRNLEDQMFYGHVTLRRLLKFILRIHSIQITQPLIKFLTGLEIIYQIAQDWEQIAPRDFKLIDELEELKALIVSWRQIELENYRNCLDNVLKRIRNQDFLKWWFHFYSMLTEILSSSDSNQVNDQLINFYNNLKNFVDGSTVGEFSNRLILIENFILHATCLNAKHEVIVLMKNLLNYYKEIEPKILEHIKTMRKDFDDQIKDKVKIIRWKKVNYFGLKNLITKSHKIVMRNMNKFSRSLGEKVNPHLFNFDLMIDQPKSKWSFSIIDLTNNLIANIQLEPIDNQHVLNLQCLANLAQFNQKCCKLIVKCVSKSVVYESRMIEFNELSKDIVSNLKELQSLSVDSKIKEKEQRKKQIKSISSKKDYQLSELIKILKIIGLSYQKGLNHSEKLNSSLLQSVRLVEKSIYLDEQSNLNIQSSESYFYKLFNKFIYFLDISQLPAKDVNQQKMDRLKGSILHLIIKIVKTRTNLSDQLDHFNEINRTIQILGKLDAETKLSRKLESSLHLFRNSSIRLKILLIQCKDVLDVLTKSDDFNVKMNAFHEIIPELISILDLISIPKVLPIFAYTEDDLISINKKLNNVADKIIFCLTDLLDINNKSKNGVLMNTLQFALELKHKLSICTELKDVDPKSYQKEKFNQLINQTEQFIKKILFKVQETFKYLSSQEFSQIDAEDETNLLPDLEKIQKLTKVLDLKSIKQMLNDYLEQAQVVGVDIDTTECELIKKLLSNIVIVLKNYLVCAHHYISLYVIKSRCLNKFTQILLGLFNELNRNGFCIPPELQDTDEQNQQDGKFKEVNDAGFGEGEGAQDVSDQIKDLNQIEGLQNDEQKNEEPQDEQNKNDEMKEEDKGVQMDDDFKGETYDKKEDSDQEEQSESEEENEMGEVENDDNVLDENVWGKSDDEDESDEKDQNEKGTDNKKGDQEQDDQMVANEDTESLEKTKETKHKEFDNKFNEESEQHEQDESEESDQFKDKDADKNLDEEEECELPDNLQLGDKESDVEDECKSEVDMDQIDSSDSVQNDEEFDEEKSEKLSDGEKEDDEIEPEDGDNSQSNQTERIDDESKLEEDENAEDQMEVDENAFDSKSTQNFDENVQFNEDIKNKNEPMNQKSSLEEQRENETGAKGDQKAYSFDENKSNLITEQNMDEMESSDLNLTDNNGNNDSRKLSESTKNLKKREILKNELNKEKKFKEDRNKQSNESDLYRHIDENMSGDEDVMDKADESHRNNIEMDLDEQLEEDKSRQTEKLDDIEMLDETINEQRKAKHNEQKEMTMTNECKDENLAKDNQSNESDRRSMISTTFVQRSADTVYHSDLDKLEVSKDAYSSIEKLEHIDNLLQKLSSNVKLDDDEVYKESSLAWRECEQVVSPLINELTAQLQLILEPTKTTKFKGDYKSGKRLNMRKIIPYIASQYRKDKIWLRRTKPSKREYQIMLALDDSGSMADNHSKKLAFESLILLGKSLNLLEVGEIGVMSFGEETRLVNSFDEPFNDTIGSKLFSQFTFKQKKTRINDLLSKVKLTMEHFRFGKKARELSQLLMIISDGRGLFSEGEMQLKSKIKQIYESGIFIVFLILDNPEHKDSICDIVVPKFETTGEVTLKSYMEEFPFPFYLIVRNIEQLPNVLGQALRQWFELVTINDK